VRAARDLARDGARAHRALVAVAALAGGRGQAAVAEGGLDREGLAVAKRLTVSAPPRGLQFLTGCWQGIENSEPSPWDREDERVSSRFDFRADQQGLCVIAEYREQLEDRVTYQAHAVLGWDQDQGCPYLFWFDGRGRGACPSPARSRWEDHKLIFECEGPREAVRFSYQLEGPDRFTFRREVASGSPSRCTVAEARFRRAPEE
jgi:hypothetical protein